MRKLMLAAALLCASVATNSQAAYSRVFVIGDSLSDNGNAFVGTGGVTEAKPYTKLIPDLPYESKTLSNGPIWVDFLPSRVTATPPPPIGTRLLTVPPFADLSGGASYAVASARSGPLSGVTGNGVPTLTQQSTALLTLLPSLPADALFIVWAGGNDVRDALDTGSQAGAAAVIQSALFNVGDILGDLLGAGARNLLVLNMPDLSRTPAVQFTDAEAGNTLASQATLSLVQAYNAGLNATIAQLESASGVDVLTLDTFALITEILNHPGTYGFSNATTPCIFENGGNG